MSAANMRPIRPVLYVSGPVSGRPDGNRPAFDQAASALRAAGYRARVPHDDVAAGTAWIPAMRTCLVSMLAQADGVALLDGWEASRGARLEVFVARALGMPVKGAGDWIGHGGKEARRRETR